MPNEQSVACNVEYEQIDTDPHFSRVIRYLRPSDYAEWACITALGPTLDSLLIKLKTQVWTWPRLYPGLRGNLYLGFIAGFLGAYTSVTQRFLGIRENAREVAMDRYEIKQRLAQGLPPHEISPMPRWIRREASRTSTNSFLGYYILFWPNFIHHEFHGVDVAKYYQVRPGEENWGFKLPPVESLPEPPN